MAKILRAKAEEILKSVKLNRTSQRVAVMEKLLASDSPVSAEHLSGQLRKNCPDKVTLYRILDRFCKEGLVHKACLNNRVYSYELSHNCGKKQCHPHFICINCQKAYCLIGHSVPMVNGLKKGFVIQRQQVRIEGLCPNCS